VRSWGVLALLQMVIWVVQADVEAIAGGHRATMLGAVHGSHDLAPVVQTGVALILAGVYVAAHGRLRRRRCEVWSLECRLTRKASPTVGSAPFPPGGPIYYGTPFELRGAQRWQRPPPPRPLDSAPAYV